MKLWPNDTFLYFLIDNFFNQNNLFLTRVSYFYIVKTKLNSKNKKNMLIYFDIGELCFQFNQKKYRHEPEIFIFSDIQMIWVSKKYLLNTNKMIALFWFSRVCVIWRDRPRLWCSFYALLSRLISVIYRYTQTNTCVYVKSLYTARFWVMLGLPR